MIAPVLEWVETDSALAFAVNTTELRRGDQMEKLERALIEALHHGDVRARIRQRSKNENPNVNDDWKNLDRDFWFGLESLPEYYSGNVDEEIEINVEDLRRWLNPTPAASPGAKRGPKPKWNWREFWIEVVAIANEPDGLGQMTRADLVRRMLGWFEKENSGESPADSQIRERVSQLYKHLGR